MDEVEAVARAKRTVSPAWCLAPIPFYAALWAAFGLGYAIAVAFGFILGALGACWEIGYWARLDAHRAEQAEKMDGEG